MQVAVVYRREIRTVKQDSAISYECYTAVSPGIEATFDGPVEATEPEEQDMKIIEILVPDEIINLLRLEEAVRKEARRPFPSS